MTDPAVLEEEQVLVCASCGLPWLERVRVVDGRLESLEADPFACPMCGSEGEPE